MPTPPDRPEGSDDPFAVAEATLGAPSATRETVPVDRPTEALDRPTEALDRPTEALDRPTETPDRPTEAVSSDDRPTVPVDNRPTVRVPIQRRPPRRSRRAPLPVAVAFATVWAAALSYLPVAAVIGLARTLEGQGGLGGAAHAGLAGWLLGHGVPIGTSIGALGLPPLLLTFLVIWRLNRAGLHVTRAIGARRSGRIGDTLLVGFAIALVYSLLGSVAALAVDGRGTEVTAARAAVNFFVLGLLGALAGAVRGTDALSALARRTPRPLRHGVRAGVMAALFMLAAGAAFTGLAVAVGGGQAAENISAFRTGVAGQAGVTLLSLAYGGNAAVWAAAYLLGPGFALGTGSIVRLTEVTVGPLPTLPLLAGLPDGPKGAAGALLLAVPVLAGLAAGWLMVLRLNRDLPADRESDRDRPPPVDDGGKLSYPPGYLGPTQKGGGGSWRGEHSWPLVLGAGLIAGPAAGVLLAALCRASSGPLGDGRLATIGPDPWQVGLIAAVVLGVSTAIGAAACRTFGPHPKG